MIPADEFAADRGAAAKTSRIAFESSLPLKLIKVAAIISAGSVRSNTGCVLFRLFRAIGRTNATGNLGRTGIRVSRLIRSTDSDRATGKKLEKSSFII